MKVNLDVQFFAFVAIKTEWEVGAARDCLCEVLLESSPLDCQLRFDRIVGQRVGFAGGKASAEVGFELGDVVGV